MGHQFAGNHTFNGTQSQLLGRQPQRGHVGRAGLRLVDHGLRRHLPAGQPAAALATRTGRSAATTRSPRWSPARAPPINEVQNVSLRDFGVGDSLTLTAFGKTTNPIVSGTNYTAAGIAAELQGDSEVQTVALAGYDTNGDSYRLSYKGANTVPIVRGQNNTAAGIANAIVGGNEQQQVTLTGFNAHDAVVPGRDQRRQLRHARPGGARGQQRQPGDRDQRHRRLRRDASRRPARRNTGFTLTFAGASANTDVPAISIVNCTGACTSTVRETAKGGTALSTWPAGATLAVGTVTDAGYTLTSAAPRRARTSTRSASPSPPAPGHRHRDDQGHRGHPARGRHGRRQRLRRLRRAQRRRLPGHVRRHAGRIDVPSLVLAVTGGSGFVGETAHGGPVQNNGYIITDTGNHAPDVTTAGASYTIPPRTPFTLTGSATDPDGDVVTYMWEQNDRGAATGTALVNQNKTNGPLFRQFGKGVDINSVDTLKYHSPGLNASRRTRRARSRTWSRSWRATPTRPRGCARRRRPPRRRCRSRRGSASRSSCRRAPGSASSATGR